MSLFDKLISWSPVLRRS